MKFQARRTGLKIMNKKFARQDEEQAGGGLEEENRAKEVVKSRIPNVT